MEMKLLSVSVVLVLAVSLVFGGCKKEEAKKEERLSKVGQSCAKTADCEEPLVCLNQKCCQPDCSGKECGSDGCDGTCGKCDSSLRCALDNKCVDPCAGKQCGDDGHGGSCGACKSGWQCNVDHQCSDPCVDKDCGDNGCGGSCGKCACGERCEAGSCVSHACDGKVCGKDGCGGSCGGCGAGSICRAGTCVASCWTDPTSELTWQITPTGGQMEWSEAKAHCASLSLTGGGWRLPTISELRTLIRGCRGTVTGGACGVTDKCLRGHGHPSGSCWNKGDCWDCSGADGPANGCYWPDEMQGRCFWYWSSSAVAGSGGRAWGVSFPFGGVYVPGSSVKYVRCVR